VAGLKITREPAPASEITDENRAVEEAVRRDWRNFTTLTFLFMFGFAIYNGVFQNFLRDTHHAGPLHLGGLESLREVPGLLAALTTGTLVALAESRVAGLGLLVTAFGIAGTGLMPNYAALIFISVFWSIGFHLYITVSPAITLTLARGRESGRHLGRMTSIGSMATLVGLGTAFGAARLFSHLPYNLFFFTAGACILVASLLCMRLSAHAEGAPRARLIFRREYGLFYLLTFLEGCRRQIFSIFASFALILVYQVPLSAMLALQFSNAILISLTAPRIGRVIDRYGERKPLIFYSVALIVVFLGYATFQTVGALYALFLIDYVLFSFGMGFTTYLHRIVRDGELTPCLAMGTTMNHIAAVTVPVGGALLWTYSKNYQLPFWVGVGIATISLFATFSLPKGIHVRPKEDS
jgi:MFS family permease